ncbi:MAG: hypothetical protein LBM71_00260 [Elusimicrobiota bacterium]|jgi:hypothetical protein|nr:hypothetical protein [Elusimicrobiota bacterium]
MKFFTNMKEGLNDISNMLLEKNYKPFLRPLVLLIVLLFLMNLVNKHVNSQVEVIRQKVAAQKAEADNATDYIESKSAYEKLAKRLPPVAEKNEWLLSQMTSIFDRLEFENPKIGKNSLEEDGKFTLSSVSVDAEGDFNQLGKLIETVENSPYFMRISSLAVNRAEGTLGELRINLKVHTIFAESK